MKKRIIFLVLIAFLSVSCAKVIDFYTSNLSVSVKNVLISGSSSFEQVDMKVDLAIKNDNLFPVYVTGFTYNVLVGKVIVASGKNPDDQSFTVKPKEEGELSLDMHLNPKKAGQEFLKAYLSKDTDIKVYGKVNITSGIGNFTLNYSHTHSLR